MNFFCYINSHIMKQCKSLPFTSCFKMLSSLWLSLVGLWLMAIFLPYCSGKRNWDYEIVSLDTFTSDEALLNITGRADRIKRGEFGLSVTVDINFDLDETTMVEATAERSNTGDESDYKPVPWTIPKQPHPEFIDGFYKDIVMNNFGSCSNLPTLDDKYTPPFPRGHFVMDKCVPNGDGFPDIAPEGYYRILVKFTGPVDWGFITVIKVITKSL